MNCKILLEKYFEFLKNNLSLEVKGGIYRLELPFPRPSRDSIVLNIIKLSEENYKITDAGFMDEYLFNYGINLWDLEIEPLKDEFERLKKAYKIISEDSPDIVIIAEKHSLFHQIYEMSELLNELSIFSKIKLLGGFN